MSKHEMQKVNIPYGHEFIQLNLSKENLEGIIDLNFYKKEENVTEEMVVNRALDNPIDTVRLEDIAVGKKTAVLITNDHTRAMRSMVTLPILLERIRKYNPSIEVKILIATGLHRATTEDEMRVMFGDKIVDSEEIIVHDAFDDTKIREVGKLPSGATLAVNELILNTDMIVTEGFIESHFFAGFSGGRKSIMPGVCSYTTVVANHSYKMIDNINATSGSLDNNPVNIDMIAAVKMIEPDFSLNVVLDKEKYIEAAFAGDIVTSHRVGCDYVKDASSAPAIYGDIVITGNGGYPLDQNLYQTPKAINTASKCCKENGVIIMCAQCEDGIGGDEFEKIMRMGSPREIDEFLSKIGPNDTIPEQWCAQIYSKLLMKNKIILVSDGISESTANELNLEHAESIERALEMAFNESGEDASVVVIPDGVRIII